VTWTNEEGLRLTPRQLDIVELLATGLTQAEVAAKLFIGVQTVKWHLGWVYRKLDARNIAHAINICWEQGILPKREGPRGGQTYERIS
jgi:DNA-binding CsgD family transcriptional regulator